MGFGRCFGPNLKPADVEQKLIIGRHPVQRTGNRAFITRILESLNDLRLKQLG